MGRACLPCAAWCKEQAGKGKLNRASVYASSIMLGTGYSQAAWQAGHAFAGTGAEVAPGDGPSSTGSAVTELPMSKGRQAARPWPARTPFSLLGARPQLCSSSPSLPSWERLVCATTNPCEHPSGRCPSTPPKVLVRHAGSVCARGAA